MDGLRDVNPRVLPDINNHFDRQTAARKVECVAAVELQPRAVLLLACELNLSSTEVSMLFSASSLIPVAKQMPVILDVKMVREAFMFTGAGASVTLVAS